jgi:L-alanine-DL-glutamate epimerase-like enolase superfamily enzyme
MKTKMNKAVQKSFLDVAEQSLKGQSFKIERVEAIVLRAKIKTAVQTSFGTMYDRPALLVKITDINGCTGYGEIWCNFPANGAEYKANLLAKEFSNWLRGKSFCSPAEIFDGLSAAFLVLGLQTGDPGTFLQIIAGIDQALWDLVARNQNQKLCNLFGVPADSVKAYASGIHPKEAKERVPCALDRGFSSFKIKVGFGMKTDQQGLNEASDLTCDTHQLMADANQAWDSTSEAVENIETLNRFNLTWIEEPLRANSSLHDWHALEKAIEVPIAGGENLSTLATIKTYWQKGVFKYMQPDIGKIGGFTGLLRVFSTPKNAFSSRDNVYCPHWLGGMVGLAASAQLLTIVGNRGLLEVDINENPLREVLADWNLCPSKQGRIKLPDENGIGITPDLKAMKSQNIEIRVFSG